MPTIQIPHDPTEKDTRWKPRKHQRGLWAYLENGGKRAIAVWHRRSGKDDLALAWASVAAHMERGNYWHMLPEASQARKAIWDAVDPHRNRRRIDVAFPEIVRANIRNSDMFIELKCGSTWQVIGSDNYNSLVGSPPRGVVFSEWALADPSAWAYLRPILEENNGWALFITTPRGPNHLKRMFDAHGNDDEWHVSCWPATRTELVSSEELDKLREDYVADFGDVMGVNLFDQEYLCSFEAAILGAVYGKQMREAREDGRIGDVPYDASRPVETWWDLGYRDPCAIWFVQRMPGGALHAVDYYENNLGGLDHYAQVLQARGYVYSRHLVPHDAAKGEIGSGRTLVEQAGSLGLRFEVQPQTSLESGISATRAMLNRFRWDARKCERGLDALSQYHYEWSQERHTLSAKPVHDWSSHGADALRTGAGTKEKRRRERPSLDDLPRVSIV